MKSSTSKHFVNHDDSAAKSLVCTIKYTWFTAMQPGNIAGALTEILRILMTFLSWVPANAPLTINGVPSLPRGPWSHIHHIPFLDTCFLIFLVAFFQWPGLYPLLVTCVMLMIYKMSDTSFFTAPIMGGWSTRGLSQKNLCFPISNEIQRKFLPQVSTMCLLFWARKTVSFIPSFFMCRLANTLLDWRPFSC